MASHSSSNTGIFIADKFVKIVLNSNTSSALKGSETACNSTLKVCIILHQVAQ